MNLGFLSNHETLDFVNTGCFNQTSLNISLFLSFTDLSKSWNKMNPSKTEHWDTWRKDFGIVRCIKVLAFCVGNAHDVIFSHKN